MVAKDLYEECICTFLATFKIFGPMRDKVENEEFLAWGEYHKMPMTEFIGAMPLYDEAFLQTL